MSGGGGSCCRPAAPFPWARPCTESAMAKIGTFCSRRIVGRNRWWCCVVREPTSAMISCKHPRISFSEPVAASTSLYAMYLTGILLLLYGIAIVSSAAEELRSEAYKLVKCNMFSQVTLTLVLVYVFKYISSVAQLSQNDVCSCCWWRQ
jgi:hypothetical protein